MKIIVNEKALDYKPLFPMTWGKLLQDLLKDFIDKEHGITGIIVDGEPDTSILTDQRDKPVSEDIQTLEFYTKDALTITEDGFKKINSLIVQLQSEISGCVDSLRKGETKQGSRKIVNILEATKPIINFINSVGMNFSLDFSKIIFDESNYTIRDKIDEFLKSFGEFIEAQKKQDYVEIADFLEYQFSEDIEIWLKISSILLEEVRAASRSV
jgi:hypothetical protein